MNYNENNENNVNSVEDLNREENQGYEYGNPYVSQPQNEAWIQMQEKEGFFKKHKFAIGLLTGVACMLFLLVGGVQLLRMTGEYFIIGGTGIHEIDNTPILDDATVDKLNEIYEWMKIYYYEDFDKNGIKLIGAGGKNQVAKLYCNLKNDLKIPIFILLDADAKTTAEQIKPILRESDKIYVIKHGEFEDIF